MLPISSEVLSAELSQVRAVVDKWLNRSEQIPGQDLPADELQVDDFVRQLCGELLLVSGKCEALASIISGDLR